MSTEIVPRAAVNTAADPSLSKFRAPRGGAGLSGLAPVFDFNGVSVGFRIYTPGTVPSVRVSELIAQPEFQPNDLDDVLGWTSFVGKISV